jgi:hypothetical protein
LDSDFIKKYFRQDLQDFEDIFLVLPHFPEENEETQSPAKRDNFVQPNNNIPLKADCVGSLSSGK